MVFDEDEDDGERLKKERFAMECEEDGKCCNGGMAEEVRVDEVNVANAFLDKNVGRVYLEDVMYL